MTRHTTMLAAVLAALVAPASAQAAKTPRIGKTITVKLGKSIVQAKAFNVRDPFLPLEDEQSVFGAPEGSRLIAIDIQVRVKRGKPVTLYGQQSAELIDKAGRSYSDGTTGLNQCSDPYRMAVSRTSKRITCKYFEVPNGVQPRFLEFELETFGTQSRERLVRWQF